MGNNPISQVDPLGDDDYTLNTKTGDVKLVKETDDKSDKVVKSKQVGKHKGEIKYKKNGEAKSAISNIEKGILRDGQNFKNKDEVISIGGKDEPSEEGVKSFALKLSEYIGLEIKGYSYSSNGSGKTTDVVLDKYINNGYEKSFGTTKALQEKYGVNFSLNNILFDFHTHPRGSLGATQSSPEISKDVAIRQKDAKYLPNAKFIILYRIPGQEMPGEYDYTH